MLFPTAFWKPEERAILPFHKATYNKFRYFGSQWADHRCGPLWHDLREVRSEGVERELDVLGREHRGFIDRRCGCEDRVMLRRLGWVGTSRIASARWFICLARFGRCSEIRTPGARVSTGLNSPRDSAGASGFKSHMSRWLGPPGR